ncbi:MAG TPA: peptidoglycan DD-metalloendopeptidase family protein [Clostridia bacterium]|nr:peptidoglycan DD-metalloendopeptidase family protein [Clostridia bacterium]
MTNGCFWRQKGIRFLAVLLAVMTFSVCLSPSYPVSAASDNLKNAQGSLKDIKDKLSAVRSDRKRLANQKEKLTGDLLYLEKRSQAQRAVYDQALEQKELALMVLEMNQEAYSISLQDYEDKLEQYEERVARMYERNQPSMLEIILSADSLQGFFTTLRFMKMVTEADEQALTELDEASILASQLQQDAEDQYQEMNKLLAESDAAMKEIEEQEKLTADQLKQVSSSLEISRQKEAQLARDEKAAAAAATPSVKPATKPAQSSSHWRGTGLFVWPLPDAHYVTSVFGWRAKYGRFHYGTDVAASVGTRIVAMADGVVTYAAWPRGGTYSGEYGNLIVIDHGNGYQTRYGHLSGFNCHIGQHVKAGQVVGYTGNTGRSSGPHLHFEVRLNGVPHDPLRHFTRGS